MIKIRVLALHLSSSLFTPPHMQAEITVWGQAEGLSVHGGFSDNLSQVRPTRRWALPNEGSRRAEGKIKSGDWWAFTLYIGDLIRWRGLWSGREFHRSLAGMEGEKSEAEKIKKEIKDRE